MKRILWKLLLAAVIFGAGFLIGDIETVREDNQEEMTKPQVEVQEPLAEEPPEEGTTWEILKAQVTSKAIRGSSDGVTYEVALDIPEQDGGERLTLRDIEYRLLQVGDVVDVLHIHTDDSTDYLQWWRDDEGRLNIHFTDPIAVIDAGHGGIDNGQGSNDLWVEKSLNLAMSERMAAQLQEAGIHVIMTRTKDEYISLYDRVAMANYVAADILISNHVNRMDGETSGVEVLYSGLSDRTFAKALAEAISSEALPVFRVYRRRSYDVPGQDYYFLHKYPDMPSYIIEYGFADNEADSGYIHEHWEAMVDRAAQAIIDELLNKKENP